MGTSMNQATDVVLLRAIGISTCDVDGEALHLLHVRNRKGTEGTFGLSQKMLTEHIAQCQNALSKGIEHQFRDDA